MIQVFTYKFGQRLVKTLRNMRFIDKKTIKANPNPPCLKGWPDILVVLEKVWNAIKKKGFPYLQLGLLSQDVLKNPFGSIRSFTHRFNS